MLNAFLSFINCKNLSSFLVSLMSNLPSNFRSSKLLKEVQKINLWKFKESLILAQDERWRDALHMQVVREFETQVADG